MRRVFLLGFLLLLPCILAAQESINNDSVIKMIKSGLPENNIVLSINTSPGSYDTSVDGLIALQEAGASEKVIEAIQAKAAGGAVPTAPDGNTEIIPSFDPKIQDTGQKIPVWVKAAGASDRFTSPDKKLSDSVRDIQNRIKSSKTLSQAPTEQDSLVTLEVLFRGVQTVDATGIDRLGGTKKIDKTMLIVRLIAEEYEQEFTEEGNADSIIAWREAARAVVNNTERWVKDNRNELIKIQTYRNE